MRTLLIAGSGDVAQRALPRLTQRWRCLALSRRPETSDKVRALGAVPIQADLDDKASLSRIAGLADAVVYCAPPPNNGAHDLRLRKLLSAITKTAIIPHRLIYISTTGVYGNTAGQWCDEASHPAPSSARALRRLDAERQLRRFAQRTGCHVAILRAPGIYARERLPLSRFANRSPLIMAGEDSISNHIHADDLATIVIAALERVNGFRIYNACDDLPLPMGEWYDGLADALGAPRLPRAPREEVRRLVSAEQWSFMAESRRIRNTRLAELGVTLRYPTVHHFLRELACEAGETRLTAGI